MREAGVDLVTVGVFSWALLEPEPGRFDFDWLDRGRSTCCTRAGSRVDLATATASPPPWLSRAHPEMLPVAPTGTGCGPAAGRPGARARRSSASARCALVDAARQALRRPPGAGACGTCRNELGCHNAHCYCDVSARPPSATGCASRYGDLDGAQRGVGHRVLEPALRRLGGDPAAAHGTDARPTRPSSSTSAGSPPTTLLELLRRRARPAAPAHPRHPGHHELHGDAATFADMDYWSLGAGAGRRRPTTTTSTARDPDHAGRAVAFSADLHPRPRRRAAVVADGALDQRRQLAAAQPRQGARAAAAQQPRPRRPRRGRASCFFQWRAVARRRREVPLGAAPARRHRHQGLARGGASSARSWAALGRGRRHHASQAEVAIVFDWRRRWAAEPDAHPTATWSLPRPAARDCTARSGTPASPSTSSRPDADLSGYRLVVVPTLYLVDRRRGRAHRAATSTAAARVLVTYFSGIVDERRPRPARRLPGRVPRPARRARRGVLPAARRASTVHARRRRRPATGLDRAAAPRRRRGGRDATPTARWPACPAVTRNDVGAGTAWYVGDAARRRRRWRGLLAPGRAHEAGVEPVADVPAGRRGRAPAPATGDRTCSCSTTPAEPVDGRRARASTCVHRRGASPGELDRAPPAASPSSERGG